MDRASPRFGAACAVLSLACLAASAAFSQQGERRAETPAPAQDSLAAAVERLAPEYRQWLSSVRGLITQAELEYFLSLQEDYRRDAFMEAFWEVRDPYPETRVNELRERWRAVAADGLGMPFDDPRFVAYLLNGPPGGYLLPNGRAVGRCFARSRELEIWFYGGSERVDREFLLIFQRRGSGVPYEVYRRGDILRPIQRTGGLPSTDVQALCADELLRFAVREIALRSDYESVLELALSPPIPSPEWLANLQTSSTDLPVGAETFDLRVEIRFPARRQSRTALQAMLVVPFSEAPGRRFEGELFHNFLVIGEVIRDGSLFEAFRYRYEGQTPAGVSAVPLGFTRYLRPGPASIRILVQDVFTDRYARIALDLEVPSPEGLPVDAGATSMADVGSQPDAGAGPSLRLLVPPGDVHAGMVRFAARAVGAFERVTFYLDDKPILTKRRPPYSVELDLGSAAEPHRVRVVGWVGGQEVATDQIWLNQAAQRFNVRLVEPRPGGIYPGSLTVRADVQTPDGQPAERVEIFLDQQRVAVIEEPPYAQSLRLPGQQAAVVRAVAYLSDGSSAEDAVVVNGSEFQEEVVVQLVELFALVVDAGGRPLLDLERVDFRVFEDGSLQEISRFQTAREAPIQAALLIDRSASMAPHLDSVAEAALRFARAAVSSPDDRIAALSFADRLTVDAGFTAEGGEVERALAGLVAHGGTSLYDSLVQALGLFAGIQGQKALLVFSDGQDEGSRLDFAQTLETVQRAGVVLYAIGLEEAFPDRSSRRVLEELASETGGRAFFVQGLDELPRAYDEILTELRSRYLLAYQSTSDKPAPELRTLRVEVDRRGAEVRTRRGYRP